MRRRCLGQTTSKGTSLHEHGESAAQSDPSQSQPLVTFKATNSKEVIQGSNITVNKVINKTHYYGGRLTRSAFPVRKRGKRGLGFKSRFRPFRKSGSAYLSPRMWLAISVCVVIMLGLVLCDKLSLREIWMHQSTSSSLPDRANLFLGRQIESDKLVDLLDPTSLWVSKSVRFASVFGIPGVGKSTLVTEIGNHLQDRGVHVYFVELVAVNDTETAIERIVTEFPVADMEKDARNTLQKFVRPLSWKTVLILDNCDRLLNSSLERDKFANLIENLMKQSRRLKIVTTSQIPFYKFDSDDVYAFHLKPLSIQSATHLVNKTAGGDKKRKVNNGQAQQIAKLCGQVPLALRIAGKLLHFDLISAENLIKQLKVSLIETLSDDDITPRVETTLELSFSLLRSRSQKHFSRFAVLPESFDIQVASAIIVGDTKESIQKTMTILVRRGLLEPSQKDGRYKMHPLLQAFGRKKLEPEQLLMVEHAIDRYFAESLIGISVQRAKTTAKSFERNREGFTWLVQRLSRNSSDSRDKQYFCLKIATTVWPELKEKAFPWGQWIRLHESCMGAFEAEPRSYLVRHYVQTAWQLSRLYLFNKTDLRSALEVVRRVEPAVLTDPPPFRVTLEYYTQFISLCRIVRDASPHDCQPESLNNSITFLEPVLTNKTKLKNFHKLNFSEFLSLLEQETVTLGDPKPSESAVYVNLPFTFYLNSVRTKKRVYGKDSNPRTLEQRLWLQANSYFLKESKEDAHRCLDNAIALLRKEKATDWQLADALFHVGYWMTIWEMPKEALRYLNESLILSTSLLDTSNTALGKGNNQYSMDSCDVFLCMGDVMLASEESTHRQTVDILYNENISRYGCLQFLQLVQLRLLQRAHSIQKIGHSEGQIIQASSNIQKSLWSAFLQKRYSEVLRVLKLIDWELSAVRSQDCFYLLDKLRALQNLDKTKSRKVRRFLTQYHPEWNLGPLWDLTLQISSERMRNVLFNRIGASAIIQEILFHVLKNNSSSFYVDEWQWIHIFQYGNKCPFPDIFAGQIGLFVRLLLYNQRNVRKELNDIVRVRQKMLHDIWQAQASDYKWRRSWIKMRDDLYNSSLAGCIWAPLILRPLSPMSMASKVLSRMTQSSNSTVEESDIQLLPLTYAVNKTITALTVMRSKNQPWQSRKSVVQANLEIDLQSLLTLYRLWTEPQLLQI